MTRRPRKSGLVRSAAIICLLVGLGPVTGVAEVSVASPFTDNAVLQRDMPLPVWGKADPGEKVTVEFAGQTKSCAADSSGRWELRLDAMRASAEPRVLQVSGQDSKRSFANVVVGEVWICSGQSNMQFAAKSVPEIRVLERKAKGIRSFEVGKTVAFTEQDRLDGQWVDGPPSSAVALAFAYFLEEAADVPVGIILTCWGSSSLEAWMPRDMTESVPHFKTMVEEFDADARTRDRIAAILKGPKPWSQADDVFLRRQTNILYNAMMHPLAPYACRGLVWYQGERNTQSMFGMPKEPWFSRNSGMLKYGETLGQWIQRYRTEWQNDQMHFLITMLPGYYQEMPTGPKMGPEHPASHSWAWMRESQLKAGELGNVSVANTVDLGDVKNVHPKDKLPVGQRLALLAVRDTLDEDVVAEGPVMKRVERQGDHLVVHFDHADGLTTRDGEAPSGFWLADDSEKWVEARAELKGRTVVLRSADLAKPLYVRYAFVGKPKVNLVNEAGLPAYPFRSDSFAP
ncbi:sialate O-acetylesterase [Haloferula chungangensis]|uniref:Sialate O-acetylesterase n=1 Tax=Haloferula chungangensis TaxID=1048331 RepID=A0ABW2LCQ9_9BACT